jgi:transcriptional regulator BetI-like protein
LGERVAERIAAIAPAATPLEAAAGVLAQLLPLDDERQREAQVWFAFVARARVDPALRALNERIDARLRELVRDALAPLGLADPELAVEEVYALIDGLALHAVLQSGRPAPQTIRRVLHAHLRRLLASDTRQALKPDRGRA